MLKQPKLCTEAESADNRRARIACVVVALAAIAMGLPSLNGAFLGGDDIQLARDHVLVNHPSWEHVEELFLIVHRDLYQPVALLSYAMNFAIGDALGFRSDGAGEQKLAFVFHLTNVLLHAINSVLVFALVRRFVGDLSTAVVAALLFAIHPLNVETVAWISGRMMLLSTLFVLWAVIVMEDWRNRRGWWQPAIVLLLVALAMMSKIRVSLPVLLLIGPLLRREWPRRNWWIVWMLASITTAVFAWVNIEASSGMFERGEAALQGPRIVRTALALSWYLVHTVIPIGLSPFHPAPEVVTWSQAGLPVAGAVLLVAAILIGWSARRTRIAWTGALWLLASIAVTLPLFPSRNTAVAERYTYLPYIGMYWVIAALLVWAARFGRRRWGLGVSRMVCATASGLAILGLLAGSWAVSGAYESDVSRDRWVAKRYPSQPGLKARLAWSLYRAGEYRQAIETAEEELADPDRSEVGEAYQVIGMAQLKLGDIDGARRSLGRAIEANPDGGRAYARLAQIHEAAGDLNGAVEALRKCVDLLPNYNPGLLELADLLRQSGRLAEARAVHEQVLANNPYDVTAANGLAEIDIAEGHYTAALQRLETLLAWMPENVPARINAGLCMDRLGDAKAARKAYASALQRDPDALAGVLNLATLLVREQSYSQAFDVLATYLRNHPTDRAALDWVCRNARISGSLGKTAALLVRAIEVEPTAADLRGRYAWLSCVAGQWDAGDKYATAALDMDPTDVWARIAACAIQLRKGDHDVAMATVRSLLDDGSLDDGDTFDVLAVLLQAYANSQPDDMWTYCVVSMMCQATERNEAAKLAADEFTRRASGTGEVCSHDGR